MAPPRPPPASRFFALDARTGLLADAGLRARLGTAARKRIEERFDIEKNIRR